MACGPRPSSSRRSAPAGVGERCSSPRLASPRFWAAASEHSSARNWRSRARLDLDHDRGREAALEVLIALDAALAELAVDPTAAVLAERLAELHEQRDGVALAAQAALAGTLSPGQREAIAFALGRIEAALRARAVASA